MRTYLIVISILVLNLTSLDVKAQDAQFSQVYSAPMYLNPALTGDTYQDRLTFIFRKQWASIPGSFMSYAASYDHRFKNINSAIGISALQDQAGLQGLRLKDYAVNYSYGVRLAPMSGIKFGLRMAHSSRDHDRNKLLFWDQVVRGGASESIETGLFEKVRYLDTGLGAIFYASKFWGGFSAMHLNRPKYSLLSAELRLPIRYSVHIGGAIPLGMPKRRTSTPTISPVVHYKWQQDWKQLDIGAYWSKEPFMLGVWYRGLPVDKQEGQYLGHDAIVFLVGLMVNNKYRIGYSYDLTISKLAGSSGGSHELSFSYEWPNSSDKKRTSALPCPRF